MLFCDRGSTPLSGQLDRKTPRGGARYSGGCAEVIQHYAGYIAQYLGDGLLVYFGYPRPMKTMPGVPSTRAWALSRPSPS